MAAPLVCTLMALAAQLLPAAATDNGALVQQRVDLHRQEPKAATAEELVAACANQLPLEALSDHVSKRNVKTIAYSVMAAFQDPNFVQTAYKALTNQTNVWKLFKQVTIQRVKKLDHVRENKNRTKEQVINRLHRFWSRHGEDFARALAAEAGVREVVSEALPEGYLRALNPPEKAGPVGVFNMSFQYMREKVDDIVDSTLEGTTADSKLLCDRVDGMLKNLSSVYSTYPGAVRVKKNPALESAVMSFAPEGGPTLLKFMNATYAMTSEVSLLFQDIIQSLKDSNSNLMQQRFQCQYNSSEPGTP